MRYLRMIPSSFIVPAVVALMVAAAGTWIYLAGKETGRVETKLEPLQKARAMGAIRNKEDSTRSTSAARIATVAHARADTAHKRAIKVDESYLIARQKLQPVPDSVLNGLPHIAVAAIEERDSLLVRADIAIAAIRADAYTARSDAAAQISRGSADSTEKIGLKLQVARTDSVAELAIKETHPRCGFKCGALIAAGTLELLHRLFFRKK